MAGVVYIYIHIYFFFIKGTDHAFWRFSGPFSDFELGPVLSSHGTGECVHEKYYARKRKNWRCQRGLVIPLRAKLNISADLGKILLPSLPVQQQITNLGSRNSFELLPRDYWRTVTLYWKIKGVRQGCVYPVVKNRHVPITWALSRDRRTNTRNIMLENKKKIEVVPDRIYYHGKDRIQFRF